jgi:hypothetical protein
MGELVDGNVALSEQFFHVSIGQPVARGRPSGEVPLEWSCSRQFLYTFDLGDDWTHPCTVAPAGIDPLEALGIMPDTPLPYWGWGTIPD